MNRRDLFKMLGGGAAIIAALPSTTQRERDHICIRAGEAGSKDVVKVTLNGKDVTNVCFYLDTRIREIGLYEFKPQFLKYYCYGKIRVWVGDRFFESD